MKKYKVATRSGNDYTISFNEYQRLMKAIGTAGKHFPTFKLQDGVVLFMKHITELIPTDIDDDSVVDESMLVRPMVDPKDQTDNDKMLNEIIRKANCEHPADSQQIFAQQTKTGMKFFRLCKECGGNRSRYISEKNLTEEELMSAMPWTEKE